ncbi:hypothetical protein IFM89_014634 [Coptis chinensis]|uniref:Uncharacterized protein n=1 Tax=Coptis chinensis TaxID=261450 RepID=A0A835HVN7_9MAGN|nr:hypothetical protein IFM89_014634 [Coptis chinensis]
MTLADVEKTARETKQQVNEMQGLMNQLNDRLIKEIQSREVTEKKLDTRFELADRKLEAKFEQLFQIMNNTKATELLSSSKLPLETTTEADHSATNSPRKNRVDTNDQGKFIRTPKLDFPRFDGSNPRAWARKCTQFFQLYPMDDLKRLV